MRLVPGQIRKTVTAAGTQEALSATPLLCTSVLIQALPGNTNKVYVGDSSVSSALNMATLSASQVVTFSGTSLGNDSGLIDLSALYVDVDTNGEGVNVGYLTLAPGTV